MAPLTCAAFALGLFATSGGQLTTPPPEAEGLPPFSPELRDDLWRRAKEEADLLGESAYTSNQKFVCGAGTWGDGPQCNQWDQGHSPCWPSAMTVSASWDTELMARWSKELAQEFGLPNRGQLAPGVNLARYAWNGRLGEYMAGEDPFFGAKMVSAMVKAYRQVPTPPLQTVKHFIPNTIEKGRMIMTEVVDERTLFEVYYPPFEAAVQAGVSGVMCSYNLVNCTSGRCNAGVAYACANDDILNKHLKDEMGFKGIVVSDWDATRCHQQAEPSNGCSPGSYVTSDVAAEAGLDLEMPTCMSYSSGVTKRAKEKATRMIWAYLVQNRSFMHTRTGQNRGWYADTGVQRRLASGANNRSDADSGSAGSDASEFCCWWPHGDASDACGSCKAKDPRTSRDHCGSSQGTWCKGSDAAPSPSPVHSKPKPEPSLRKPTPPARTVSPTLAAAPTLCPDEGGQNYRSQCKLALADRIIAESSVVLKNEGGVLPLSKMARVALVGAQACANDPLAQGGGSGWNGFACNQVPKVNVQKGIEGLENGPHLACPNNGADNSEAKDADVVLAVVVPAKASEGQDRATLQLEREDVELIKKYSEMGKKVVVAMNAPGPMITSTWDAGVAAIVVSWLPGVQNGRGIAIALYNEGYEASGRLPFTFPNCSTASCSMADELASVALGDQVANDAVRVFTDKALIGYRWYHAHERSVSFPFGFGLFHYGSAEVRYSSASAMALPSGVSVTAHLSHSGPSAGRDVPQLYISFPSVPGNAGYGLQNPSRPEWVLKGFEKVLVKPGALRTVQFHLSIRDLSYWDDSPGHSHWVCAGGVFRACVGANARDAILPGKGACTTFQATCPAALPSSGTAVVRRVDSHAKVVDGGDTASFLRKFLPAEARSSMAKALKPAASGAALFLTAGAAAVVGLLAAAAAFRRRRALAAAAGSTSNAAHSRLPLWAGETEEQSAD
jgi:beta-glucosidase-like glycosyl hydrolase/nicotinamidase-related amidase